MPVFGGLIFNYLLLFFYLLLQRYFEIAATSGKIKNTTLSVQKYFTQVVINLRAKDSKLYGIISTQIYFFLLREITA